MTGATGRRDVAAVAAGALRLASGASFLVAPKGAHKLWAGPADFGSTVSLLLRSIGYRDALIGGAAAGGAGRPTAGWFLASAGADTADLVGGLTNHAQMTRSNGVAATPALWSDCLGCSSPPRCHSLTYGGTPRSSQSIEGRVAAELWVGPVFPSWTEERLA